MYNYFKIKKYHAYFKNLKDLMHEYWESLPREELSEGRTVFLGDSNKASELRTKIVHLLPFVTEAADMLGISHRMESYPPPITGGPVIPVEIYKSIIQPNQGYRQIERQLIVDTVEKSISASKKCEREALNHWLCPWNWLIDSCALIIRFSFLILRRAGLPPKVEENIIAHSIKILFLIIIITYLSYKGLKLQDIDLLKLIGF
jgi:hypothetical protein